MPVSVEAHGRWRRPAAERFIQQLQPDRVQADRLIPFPFRLARDRNGHPRDILLEQRLEVPLGLHPTHLRDLREVAEPKRSRREHASVFSVANTLDLVEELRLGALNTSVLDD